MRLRPLSVVTVLAAGSCFQVAPLPDCADPSGLYAPYYVCMPPAGPPLTLSAPPRQLLRADFDDEGVDNDFAVLVDDTRVQVFTAIDLDEPAPPVELAFAGGRVQAIGAARFYQNGEFGDDLFAVALAPPNMPEEEAAGRLIGAANGGDVFASGMFEPIALQATVEGSTLPDPRPCPQPSSIAPTDPFMAGWPPSIIVGCRSAATKGDPLDGPLDAVLVVGPFPTLTVSGKVGIAEDTTNVHAVTTAAIDGFGGDEIVFVHRPPGSEHDVMTVLVLGENFSPRGEFDVEPAHAEIDRVIAADVDDDADVDLVAIHSSGRGVSVIRQRASDPLAFEAPEFYGVGFEVRDAAVADFTGDGATDIAVAHEIDNTGVDVITMFVRSPDLPPGTTGYALAPALVLSGEIIDLQPLDFDADDRVDLAASVRKGAGGEVHVFLNRSPAGS